MDGSWINETIWIAVLYKLFIQMCDATALFIKTFFSQLKTCDVTSL